jgi:hypothetical protein
MPPAERAIVIQLVTMNIKKILKLIKKKISAAC